MDPETKKELSELEKQIEELNNEKTSITNTINKLSPGVTAFIAFFTLFSSGIFQFFSITERVNSMSYRMTDISKQIQELDNTGTRKGELKFSLIEEKMRNQEKMIEDLHDELKELRDFHEQHDKGFPKKRSDTQFDTGSNSNTLLTKKTF